MGGQDGLAKGAGCCRIPPRSQVAQHGSPWPCTRSNVGTELRRPIAIGCGPSPDETFSGNLARPECSSCHFVAAGACALPGSGLDCPWEQWTAKDIMNNKWEKGNFLIWLVTGSSLENTQDVFLCSLEAFSPNASKKSNLRIFKNYHCQYRLKWWASLMLQESRRGPCVVFMGLIKQASMIYLFACVWNKEAQRLGMYRS